MKKNTILTTIYTTLTRPLILTPLSVAVYAGVIFVLATGREDRWYSYLLYSLSAIVLVLDVKIIGKVLFEVGKKILMHIPLTRRILTDFDFRQRFFYFVSIAINLLYIAINLLPGIAHRSIWLVALGIYYIVLVLLRVTMAKSVSAGNYGTDLRREYAIYRNCGIILLLLDMTLAGIVTLMAIQGFRYAYSFYMCILMAVYVFYYFIFALVQVFRFRRYHSPLLSAVRIVSFVSAMLSVLALETAMLSQFGENETEDFDLTFISITGFVIVVFVAIISIYMIAKGRKKLENTSPS